MKLLAKWRSRPSVVARLRAVQVATLPAFRGEVCNFAQTLWAAPTENNGPHTPNKSVMNRNYTQTMTALSAWVVALCCPHCGRTGTGTVSEGAGSRLRADSLSSGFGAVELRPGAGQDIRCVTCNSSALK
jgi:hypothetical protein